MATNEPVIININGHRWEVVEGTTARTTYKYEDVINAGGHIPVNVFNSKITGRTK